MNDTVRPHQSLTSPLNPQKYYVTVSEDVVEQKQNPSGDSDEHENEVHPRG